MLQFDESQIANQLGALIADARYADALELLNRCLLLGPDDAWLNGMRALLLLESGDITSALSASAVAVELAPMAAFAHWTRGVVLLRANKLPEARRSAERSVALDPEESDTHVLLARVFLQKQQWESARAAVADAATRGADEEELMPLRAAIAAGRGLDARAGDIWRAFASRYPANALARTGHAWTLLEQGDVYSAHSEFEQARLLDPTNSWAMEGLVITKTRMLPVHRRWWTVTWGRLMQRREQTMIVIGALLASVGMALLLLDITGIGVTAVLTVIGAFLPIFDAWRQKGV